jgi:SEC-C motif-containing protein
VKPVKECPCGSGARYRECCGPRHDGTKPAETPEALMRSRWSAFALGLGDYLVDTLTANHEDRKIPRDALARALSQAKDRQRFMALTIKALPAADQVTFHARIFEKGKDVSFTERSTFVQEDGRWKYASGEIEE